MATTIKIDNVLKARLQNLASLQDRSPHWLMKEAIRQYVEKEELRQQFKQEALVSWEQYSETGLHITNQEAKDWLDGWGTNKEQEAPKCHE